MKFLNRKQYSRLVFFAYTAPFFCFVSLLAITIVIFTELTYKGEQRKKVFFESRADRAEAVIISKIENHIQVLEGVKGFFLATDTVAQEPWNIYMNNLDLTTNFSAIQGIGYAPFIHDYEKDNFLSRLKRSPLNDLKIYPEGKRKVYIPIFYLYPENKANLAAMGFDMYSENKRKKAMQSAMENNRPGITGKVKLVQEITEEVQAGFLIYVPLYKTAKVEELQPEKRVDLIRGFIYSPFRMGDFMLGTLGTRFMDIHIKVYDGTDLAEENLMFDSHPDVKKADPKLSYYTIVDFKDQSWRLEFSALPGFGSYTEKVQPFVVLIGGSIISILVFFFMWALANQRRSNELRKVITDNATAGLFILDSSGCCTFMNPAAEFITGYHFEELKGQLLHEKIHYKHRDGSSYPAEECPLVNSFSSRKEIKSHQDVFIHKNGHFLHVSCAARPVMEKGNSLLTVLEVRDITLEKQAQKRLEEAQNNLEMSEAHYRSIAEGMPVLVWTATKDGKIEYFNKRWFEFTGVKKYSDNSSLSINSILHPDEAQKDKELWTEAIKEGKNYENLHRLRRFDGQYRWHLSRALPLKDNKGNITKWFVTSTDTHDQILQNEELLRINKDLDNFVYTASHDLKAPISNLEGLVSLIFNFTRNKIDQKEIRIFDMIHTTIGRFKNTIHDLTEITKIQKQVAEDVEMISFRERLEDITVQIQKMIEEADAKIVTDFQVEKIQFSKKNLHSILYNLVSNAIKYRSSERRPVIKIRTEEYHEYILLSVKDNGLGIDPKKINKLFTMFRRLHDHVEGTGIGLYIVKRILDNSEGKIEVESHLGEGTTFKAYFKKEYVLENQKMVSEDL